METLYLHAYAYYYSVRTRTTNMHTIQPYMYEAPKCTIIIITLVRLVLFLLLLYKYIYYNNIICIILCVIQYSVEVN